jgi:hypothetical protein
LRRLSDKGIRIRIITHRLFIKYFHQAAIQQTIDWLDHYGIPYWDLCFMKDKAAVGADLYIEDSPGNVKALRADGHETIVFTNSTNLDIDPPRANTLLAGEFLLFRFGLPSSEGFVREALQSDALTAKVIEIPLETVYLPSLTSRSIILV